MDVRVWIMGYRVFSRWPVAVVCANYNLGESRCRNRDMLTDLGAPAETHTVIVQAHTLQKLIYSLTGY